MSPETGRRLPLVDRRLELLARLVRSAHGLHPQRRGRNGCGRRAGEAHTHGEEAQVHARRRLPQVDERQLQGRSPQFSRQRLDQCDRRQRGKQVWKFATPEPERGGVTTTDSGLGFAGGGDGVLRAFDVKTGKVLWTFQTGHPIAAGPSIYSVGGIEYVAITVGGTPTSSNGGTATQLQVFALGHANAALSPRALQAVAERMAPARANPNGIPRTALLGRARAGSSPRPDSSFGRGKPSRRTSSASPAGCSGTVHPSQVRMSSSTTTPSPSRRRRTDHSATAPTSLFPCATSSAWDPSAAQLCTASRSPRPASCSAKRVRRVQRRVRGTRVERTCKGRERRRHRRVTDTVGGAPPPVHLLTYRLAGHDHRCQVAGPGAVVITRTQDQDFWTHSSATTRRATTRRSSRPRTRRLADPVLISVGVARRLLQGNVGTNVAFARLKSATANIQLGSGASSRSAPTSTVGRVFGAHPRRPHRRPGREAARGALAGCKGDILVHASAVGSRTDAHAVGERATVVISPR